MKDYVDKMNAEEARMFREAVVNIVGQIPCGKVTTYGHIAALAGWPSHSRMVGRTLRYTPECASLPCHRVVNAVGRTAPGWLKQRELTCNVTSGNPSSNNLLLITPSLIGRAGVGLLAGVVHFPISYTSSFSCRCLLS